MKAKSSRQNTNASTAKKSSRKTQKNNIDRTDYAQNDNKGANVS